MRPKVWIPRGRRKGKKMPIDEVVDCVSAYDGANVLVIAGFIFAYVLGAFMGFALCRWRTRTK